MLRFIRWFAYLLVVASLAFWASIWLGGGAPSALHRLAALAGLEPSDIAGEAGLVLPSNLDIGGPFVLTDHFGKRVSDAEFRGRWLLIYFGYTYCPDVCPTELQTVAAALEKLGPRGAAIVPLFVTIDPERDTPAVLAEYVKLFDDRLIGLTGTPDEIAAMAKRFRVYYAKTRPKGDAPYLMDHSSFLYLMGPDGRFRALFRQGMGADQLADALGQQLAAGG
jgi:protein SCO1/2